MKTEENNQLGARGIWHSLNLNRNAFGESCLTTGGSWQAEINPDRTGHRTVRSQTGTDRPPRILKKARL